MFESFQLISLVEVQLDQKCTLRYDIVKGFIYEHLCQTGKILLTPNFALNLRVQDNLSKFVRTIDIFYEPKYPYSRCQTFTIYLIVFQIKIRAFK